MNRSGRIILCIAIATSGSAVSARSLSDSRAPGPYFPLSRQAHATALSFRYGRPVVGTTYFYWYDVYSGQHIRNADGTDAFTDHPPASTMPDLSYKSVEWHYSQLRDMREAGIDFLLPVTWGVPGDYQSWSFAGLSTLVQAHDRMLAEDKASGSTLTPPTIGMFYDTDTLAPNRGMPGSSAAGDAIDLTTDAGREWFYVTIRDFFSLIPPDKWARVDGKPIVFLYTSNFAKAVDERLFPDTQRRFRKDFNTGLFIVREVSWPGPSDASYRWGGALAMTIGEGVAGLGPGYDHSAVPGRPRLVVSRQGGSFYTQQWERLLRMKAVRRPWMVHVETWNEYHEGTDVARSQEYGDKYIRATAESARMFKAGVQLDSMGPFSAADHVRWSARQVEGIELVPSGGDGCWQADMIDGSPAITTTPCREKQPPSYAYFRVDNSYLYDEQERAAEIAIVFRDDGGCERFQVEYDNNDATAGALAGAFRASNPVTVGSTGTWRTVRLVLSDVRFVGRANGADLRLTVLGGKARLSLREVIVRKLPGVEIRLQPVATRPGE